MKNQRKYMQLTIFGRVQGVTFRNSLAKYAKSLKLVGNVQNLEDGSVLVNAFGKKKNLEKLLLWSQHGPPLAKVTGFNVEWLEGYDETYKEFKVIRDKNFLLDQAKSFTNLGKRALKPFEKINVPNHIVIIPDGNRRWAREKGWKAWVGHWKGIEARRIEGLIEKGIELDVKYLSFWGFSTENWNRHENEIEFLWKLYRDNIDKWENLFFKHNVRFRHLGRRDRLPADIVVKMEEMEQKTKHHTKFGFQFCLDYGGRDDLIRAYQKMIDFGVKRVNESTIAEFLDTKLQIPDPDLIIRTSGERRTSGIMAFQATYAELYFTDKKFPDFDKDDLQTAILDFSGRTRRFGGTAKQDFEGIDVQNLKIPNLE